MTQAHDRIHRAAFQQLETTMLLGVDFVPDLAQGEGEALQAVDVAQDDQQAPGHGPVFEGADDGVALGSMEVQHGTETDVATSLEAIDTESLSSPEEKARALEHLRALHDRACPHCTHVTGHTMTVFGEGHPDADLMFIGEAPGAEEDRTGRPFVGRAGKKLDEIIGAMKLQRDDVYIANVLKARPPENRTPMPDEVARCSPFLIKQVRIIRPRVIVTLGGPATKLILDTTDGITRLRGAWASFHAGDYIVPVMPTFHPAYLLRNYTKDTRGKVWSDIQQVIKRLSEGA